MRHRRLRLWSTDATGAPKQSDVVMIHNIVSAGGVSKGQLPFVGGFERGRTAPFARELLVGLTPQWGVKCPTKVILAVNREGHRLRRQVCHDRFTRPTRPQTSVSGRAFSPVDDDTDRARAVSRKRVKSRDDSSSRGSGVRRKNGCRK